MLSFGSDNVSVGAAIPGSAQESLMVILRVSYVVLVSKWVSLTQGKLDSDFTVSRMINTAPEKIVLLFSSELFKILKTKYLGFEYFIILEL